MGSKPRGRERLVNCDSCGRRIPRDKALTMDKVTVYSTEFKGDTEEEKLNDVRTMLRSEQHFCVSCGKHRHLFEKKKQQMARNKERWGSQDKESGDRWGRNERF
ncbi:MAG: hypothetical protein WC492_00450 [Candidatus Micrarchaeia archaeon]